MNWSLYLGKYAGIKVFIHWTFSLLVLWIAISGITQGQSASQIGWTMIFILAVFACVTFHEFGHALMAKKYNFKTKYITLLPIGGLAQMEKLPDNPRQELAVAIAGPMVNIVIALLLYPFVKIQEMDTEAIAILGSDTFLFYLFSVNIILALFNLLPAFPMDGGRVLRALLSFRMPRNEATRIAAGIGQFMAIGFVFLGLFYNPFLVLIGIFIFLGAQAENSMVQSQSLLKGFFVKDVLMSDFQKVSPYDTLAIPTRQLLNSQATDFIVMEGDDLKGILSRGELIKGLSEQGKDARVADVMNAEFRTLSPEQPLEEVFLEIKTKNQNILPVLDEGKLIGVVDSENISEFILVKEAIRNSQADRIPV